MDAWPPRIAFPISHFVKIQSQQARGLVQTREAWHFLILFSLNWSSPCVACALCGRARCSVTQWGVIAFMVLCTNKWLIATATFCTLFSFEISVALACGWICHSIEYRRHTWDSFTLQPWLYSSAETLLERFLLLKWITRHCFDCLLKSTCVLNYGIMMSRNLFLRSVKELRCFKEVLLRPCSAELSRFKLFFFQITGGFVRWLLRLCSLIGWIPSPLIG